MDKEIAIILDTNIFGSPNNYHFNSDIKLCSFLKSLSTFNNISIFIPDIVVNEIKKHIKETLNDDKRTNKSYYFKSMISKEIYDEAYNKYCNELDMLIKKYDIIIIDCNKYIDINEINKWYFNVEYPFENNDNKKNEFPDAMIISAVNNYFKDSKYTDIYFVSCDKGLREGLNLHTNIKSFNGIIETVNNILDYDINNVDSIYLYLRKNNILSDNIDYYSIIGSYNPDDTIDIDKVDNIKINHIDIIYEEEKNITFEVNYDFTLYGEFIITDPYESFFDKEEYKYTNYVYKTSNKIDITGVSICYTLTRDEKNEIISCDIEIPDIINLCNYLNQMEKYNNLD